MINDLNDLLYFALVVEHGGFTSAERATGIPKSRLSRRISALEEDMGVSLLQRSTRRFAITEVGQMVYRHAQGMLLEVTAAREVVERISSDPRGVVRVSAPTGLSQTILGDAVASFHAKFPEVRVLMQITNRRIDLINDGVDVALRVRSQIDEDANLVVETYGQIGEVLVASPGYLDEYGRPRSPADLANHHILTVIEDDHRMRWILETDDGRTYKHDFQPRVAAFDFTFLGILAEKGQGITMLPDLLCAKPLAEGRLERVLPQWHLPFGILHAAFPARRSLLPAVRAFIAHLGNVLPGTVRDLRYQVESVSR